MVFSNTTLHLSLVTCPPNPSLLTTVRDERSAEMENFRPVRSPGSERFLGLYHPETNDGAGGVELNEDEVLWSGNHSPENNQPPGPPLDASSPSPNPNPSHLTPSPRGRFRRPPDRSFGILAALPEDDQRRGPRSGAPFLQRNPTISSPPSASTSPSSSVSAARMIPAIVKLKKEYSLSLPSGKIQQQSAPVNVPVGPGRPRRGPGGLKAEGTEGEDGDEEEEMLPPHEIVAMAGKGSPMTTFSVLEGAGRTLKGRDLRRVRNAVWHKTGFLD